MAFAAIHEKDYDTKSRFFDLSSAVVFRPEQAFRFT